MKTLTATTQATTQATTKKHGIALLLDKQMELFEKSRFGMMALMLTAQSIIGGVAAMFIMQNGMNVVELCIVSMATMGANAVMIAQADSKTCLVSFYISNLISIAFIIANLF